MPGAERMTVTGAGVRVLLGRLGGERGVESVNCKSFNPA